MQKNPKKSQIWTKGPTLLAVIALGIAGCSSNEVGGPVTGAGPERSAGSIRPGAGHHTPKKGRDRPSGQDGGSNRSAGATAGNPGEEGGRRPKTRGPGRHPRDPVRTVSRVRDPAADADTHGETPAYVEITGASFAGGPESAVLSQSFAGDVPERMPDDDTFTYLRFALESRGRDFTVSATCDTDGWRADVDGEDDFPGGLSVEGRTLRISVPWDALGGRGRFTWYSTSSWTRSTLLNTYYAFDTAPNDERERFPE